MRDRIPASYPLENRYSYLQIVKEQTTGTVPADKRFWIYRRGIPEQVTEDEIDLFIFGLSGAML